MSPLVHNAAFAHERLNKVYLPFRVPKDMLDEAVKSFDWLPVQGYSVTLPHKETVLSLTDNHDGPISDLGAAISSGSFQTMGMIIAPCSVRSMAEIATGVTTSLLTRAADVVLKERRKLVLMLRESPLHTGHLRNLTLLSEMGAIIAPPLPAFYTRPQTVAEIVDHSVGRVLDLLGIESGLVRRWGESPPRLRAKPSERPARAKPKGRR